MTTTAREATRPWLGVSIALGVLGMLAFAELGSDSEGESETGILIAILLVAAISGLLVAKRPHHPVSWLFSVAAGSGAIAGVSADVLPPGISKLTWWQNALAIVSGPAWYGLLLTMLIFIPLLFPTGRLLSARWRWVGWVAVAVFAVMAALWVIQERFCTDFGEDGCLASVANPIGIGGIVNAEESVLGGVAYGLLLVHSLAALTSLVVRFRRSPSLERQQIKWVVFSFSLFILVNLLVDGLWLEASGRPEPPGYWLVQQTIWVLIPASIAVAILRYRLYNIDRIISRTVSYALLAGLLGLVFFGLTAVFTTFLPSEDPLAVAAATLAVAALFNPARARVQLVVDRRFNRPRYDAGQVIAAFAGSLRDRVDPDTVVEDWIEVVSETTQPVSVGVWVRKA